MAGALRRPLTPRAVGPRRSRFFLLSDTPLSGGALRVVHSSLGFFSYNTDESAVFLRPLPSPNMEPAAPAQYVFPLFGLPNELVALIAENAATNDRRSLAGVCRQARLIVRACRVAVCHTRLLIDHLNTLSKDQDRAHDHALFTDKLVHRLTNTRCVAIVSTRSLFADCSRGQHFPSPSFIRYRAETRSKDRPVPRNPPSLSYSGARTSTKVLPFVWYEAIRGKQGPLVVRSTAGILCLIPPVD